MTPFLAASPATKEALRTADLVRNLNISCLITGEPGTGKSLLAAHILPDAPVVEGDAAELAQVLSRHDAAIVEGFERLDPSEVDLGGKRIVATASGRLNDSVVDTFFGITLHLPPFRERPEDVEPIAHRFLAEAAGALLCDEVPEPEISALDLSRNGHTLRRSVYMKVLAETVGEEELLAMMERFLSRRLEGENAYRENLYLYDRPLIEAGMAKLGSQLQLSRVLGINRNTLRKKIYELGIGE